jgi:hypothetical protein
MAYDIKELDASTPGYELTGNGKDKGTVVKVSKQDVERITGGDEKKLKAELDRQFGFAHHRRLKAERTAKETAK